ncbi:MAG TPA: hypothetical protein GYA10_00535 [Alphaproteobacteria bacterium]|nr:hypothetical protein [Alphaproteobacteria bacterium]
MTTTATFDRRVSFTLEERLLLGAITYFLLLRLVYVCFAFPVADETYYWLWGRHLALSYYDHPPLQGWLQGLSYMLFGRSLLALRWMTIAALAGVFWLFSLVAKRVAGEDWRPMFLRSATVYLGSPLFGFFSTIAFHDYLLVLLVMASGYYFIRAFASFEERGDLPRSDLFIAAILLGLAGLTKYNGAFLGLAVAGVVVVRPQLRPLLLRWELYVAAVIAIAIQTPVIVWNVQEGFASFLFQMGTRHGEAGGPPVYSIAGMKAFAGEALLMVSPFMVPIIILFFWGRQRDVFERIGKTIAIWTFWISTLTCLYVASFSWVIWWWNIVAYVLILPFSGRYARGWLLGLHVAWGAIVNTVLTASYAVVPVAVLFGAPPGMETERSYAVEELVAAVEQAKAQKGADFIASNHYIVASQIAFVLDNPDIVALTGRHYAFDDWFDPETRRGQSAIVVVEPNTETEAWRRFFTSVTDLGEFRATRFGYPINTYRLFFAEGFLPPNAPQP